MYQFQLHFDGGKNPKDGAYGSYELACEIHAYRHKRVKMQFDDEITNSMAEYMALIHGLKTLLHHAKNGSIRDRGGNQIMPSRITLEIFSDSMMVVRQVTKNWNCRVLHLQELIDESRALLKQFGHWNLKWRPRKFNVERFGH